MRRRRIVSTVKKSQAIMLSAWARMNSLQERTTAPTPSRTQPAGEEDLPHGRRRDRDPEACQLTDDSPISPAWVLPRHPQDERPDRRVHPGAAGSAARVGPAAGDEVAMPGKQGLRRDEEGRPAPSRQQAAGRRQKDPISRSQIGSMNLAAQDGELVPKDDDLQLLVVGGARAEGDQSDELAQGKVEERNQQWRSSDRGPGRRPYSRLSRRDPRRIEFVHPTSGHRRGQRIRALLCRGGGVVIRDGSEELAPIRNKIGEAVKQPGEV